jgi:hypothetical protein
MERDPQTGRFLPGNKAAAGNRGNRKPKWGNKNAFKHGLWAEWFYPQIKGDQLVITSQYRQFCIKPGYFYQSQDGRIWIHDDAVPLLEKIGVKLDEEVATK